MSDNLCFEAFVVKIYLPSGVPSPTSFRFLRSERGAPKRSGTRHYVVSRHPLASEPVHHLIDLELLTVRDKVCCCLTAKRLHYFYFTSNLRRNTILEKNFTFSHFTK
jgi:hypothetical protein